MSTPETRYASSGDCRIAYQVVGHGPTDLVFVPGFISNLEVHWEDPGYTHLLKRLAAFTRLILLDKRGTGLSDRVDVHHLPSLETRMDDVRAVMDAAGSVRAVLLGASEGAPMSILFAATYPERTRALVLYGGYAHFHTWVAGREALDEFVRNAEMSWGTGASLRHFAPGRLSDPRFQEWWARFERLSVSPTAAVALARMNAQIDVRQVLGSIRVPTRIIHRADDARVKLGGGRYLAEHIKDSRLVEIPGRDHPVWTGDTDRVVDEIEEFLTGVRPTPVDDRVLATVMVARLVFPEHFAARLGDTLWSERLERLRQVGEAAIARLNGRPITAGAAAISARFDGPARAVRCALALRDAAAALGLPFAAGVHTGEIEVRDDHVTGLALHITERIASRAAAGDVLVSGVVSDLAAGSDLRFAPRESEAIVGIQTPIRILEVVTEHHLEPATRRTTATSSIEILSDREREVLALVADGMSNAAIAKRLRLSDHTVKRHVANILLKLDLPTRAAAAALAGRERRA
ncbi:MAG: alpha/beta fold hydrolase [Alphaproteobacteria bacterium]|nr:alpha/beta fold hydrolase [Alphaproteobacteria bacterium]